jgi:hypothetical protein
MKLRHIPFHKSWEGHTGEGDRLEWWVLLTLILESLRNTDS